MKEIFRKFFSSTNKKIEEQWLSQETMENIASVFGFTNATPEFDRWVTRDGCRYTDVPSALSGSKFILLADWRDDIVAVLESVKRALGYWKVKIVVVPDSDNIGIATLVFQSGRVELTHQLDEGWHELFLEIQRHLPQNIEIREATDNTGSDTEEYVLLLQEEWAQLESIAGEYFLSHYRKIT